MKYILILLGLLSASVISGCSATGYGVSGSVDAPPETDRWEAWARSVEADAAARKPTMEVVQYQADGVTPASKITMDLGPILGKGVPPAPKGPVAEAIEATGDGIAKIANTPVATLVGASVLVGQATGNSTTIESSGGATSVGSGTSGVSTTTKMVEEAVEEGVE